MPSEITDENDSSVGQKRMGALQIGPRKKCTYPHFSPLFSSVYSLFWMVVVVQIPLFITAGILGALFMPWAM